MDPLFCYNQPSPKRIEANASKKVVPSFAKKLKASNDEMSVNALEKKQQGRWEGLVEVQWEYIFWLSLRSCKE
jgi:hypothetical protein